MYKNARRKPQQRDMHYSPNLAACLDNAIESQVKVELEYHSFESGVTHRVIEPMATLYKNRKKNVVAWCHLRNDWRCFRLDRINLCKVSQEQFEPREDFDISDFEDLYEEESAFGSTTSGTTYNEEEDINYNRL